MGLFNFGNNNRGRSNGGQGNLGIDSLSTGISSIGMENYLETLKANLITSTVEKLNNITEIETAIDAGWQGVAKERFMTQFETLRQSVSTDLEKEYQNLVNRLNELEEQYFQADINMIDE